ncbi:hypothetical protein SLEP1_g47922 [Rubroshorea leprosula]|uniref:Uncharacterized protein n=1 Tax=Rubroshorea leprosula TaxID=152421 RepID=A0AAV5LS16_9ROSI|nr:hypothetical protein SLEP1_g47922 [Rubroshorea leprosula]
MRNTAPAPGFLEHKRRFLEHKRRFLEHRRGFLEPRCWVPSKEPRAWVQGTKQTQHAWVRWNPGAGSSNPGPRFLQTQHAWVQWNSGPRRALEDLRASIFNKFRPSESAKTQQQRIWGPFSALTFNFMVAVGIIFMNKWVLKNVGFQFLVFLTFIHYLVSWALMAVLKSFEGTQANGARATRDASTLNFASFSQTRKY